MGELSARSGPAPATDPARPNAGTEQAGAGPAEANCSAPIPAAEATVTVLVDRRRDARSGVPRLVGRLS
jgi:hypothetical protein